DAGVRANNRKRSASSHPSDLLTSFVRRSKACRLHQTELTHWFALLLRTVELARRNFLRRPPLRAVHLYTAQSDRRPEADIRDQNTKRSRMPPAPARSLRLKSLCHF